MSKIMHTRHSLLELLLTMAIGLVPLVSGLLVMVYQLEKKHAENSRVSVQEAIFAIDRTLDRMSNAALQALPLAGKSCVEVMGALRAQVNIDPALRSLALTRDKQPYCNTVADSLSCASKFAQSGQQVALASDSPGTPGALIVKYQLPGANPSVIATAYDTELRNELRGFQDGLTLLLEFDDAYIWSDGDSRDSDRPSQTEFFVSAVSTKYGYTVKGGYSEGYTAQEARQSMLQILPSLALVGIVTGSIIYWGLFKSRHNRRLDLDTTA